jgi:serine/threonine protein kinase
MICPRCSVAEISPESNRCVLCGYSANAAPAVAVDVAAPMTGPQLDPIAREELAQFFHFERVLDVGFVTAYLARETETERKVVLRTVPRQPVRDAGLEDRLLHELATAASLDHPHVVPLYRYGATPRYVWFSGKHVPGQSLGELLRASGPLELQPSLRLVEQVASALQYAHRRGVVHADVQPANVRLDPNGWSLLSGFAVGRALDRLPLTVLGGRSVRRPEYLAPEERYSRQPGPAADQYSLAVLVYECLTGTLPFDGMSPDDAVPPALMGPHPDIPEHVQLALRRALSTRPTDRYQSILEFVSVLESEPAPRPAKPAEISRPSSRNLPPQRRSLPSQRRPRSAPDPVAAPGPGAAPGAAPAPPPPSASAPPQGPGPAGARRRTPTNTDVLVFDGPSPWRAMAKWIALVAVLAVGAVFGPAAWQRIRSSANETPATARPGGEGTLVARDSGSQQAPAQRPQLILPPAPSASEVLRGTAPVARAPATPTTTAGPRPVPPPVARPTPPRPVVAAPGSSARLFVNSTPWGQLYIDGQLVGNTPQANLVVPAGARRIRVSRDGFQPWERALQLAPGQELRLTDIVLQAVGP